MAAPNPERELDRLRDQLQQLPAGTPPQCVVISGASAFFRAEAVDMVLAAIPADHDLRTLDGEANKDTDGREILDLRGGNLFGGGTFLAIRRGESWLKRHGAALPDALSRIAPACGFLLEVQKLDRRTKMAKSLLKVGDLFEFRDLYTEPYDRSRSALEAEMVGWIVQRSRRLRCPLTAESAFLLMTSVGTRPSELVQELERLRDRLGDGAGDQDRQQRRALSPDALAGHLTCSFESTPFELAEALLGFDRRRAIRSLTAMYRRGARSRDGSAMDPAGLFPFIVSWLYQATSQVHEGRQLLDAGMSLQDIPARIGVRVFVERYLSQVRNNPSARLARGQQLLLQCQRDLRMTGEDPQLLLERFLACYFDDSSEGAA